MWRLARAVLLLLAVLSLVATTAAQQCSRTNPCAAGCCSQHGFCGVGDEFCGAGCLSNCDYKTDCDANRHCEIGCCSQHGHCGIGPDFCGDGCQSTCDFRTDCDENNHCATGCCSAHGFCGTTAEHCGAGCLSTCDFKLGCDASNPCKDGTCCSKDGFCGLGPDYCAPENCLATCDAKSHCDPGYGREWSEIGDCPLNVCCSKFGFCGTSEEFCGENRVTRPSCEVTTSAMTRVIGYYEGWATGRSCDSFPPENIPAGVYTHINFAFASIDPDTYRIVPAASGDPALYRRLAALKRTDPNLQIFIAIGGWAFSDPGPTRTVFSDIARSETAQRTFFASLLSFLNTYDFDGVDIDWEYPAADDRGGREEDYFNMPKFIRNMRMALLGNGRRNGLTVTVPASYWYLRHFDLQAMEQYVDWFNIMTYDLHGTWDTPESWLGNHLNTHTNLTEITEAMDLMWRNHIPSSKVVMGLAFYSRTFTASSTSCMTAGCLFDSGGRPGPCSDTAGVLTNSEIDALLVRNFGSLGVTLDREAAVKIYKYGDQWITYDDADTFKLKVNFARSQCMGGVMVWALSQDSPDARSSWALQKATNYISPATIRWESNLGEIAGPGDTIPREQCIWTNCGSDCPRGWSRVPRRDPNAHSDEYMTDGTSCGGVGFRLFCCPPGPSPWCQWLNFNGGKCNPDCLDAGIEIASYEGACNNGLSQLACCSTKSHSDADQAEEVVAMKIWDKCRWAGKEPNCPSYAGVCDSVPGDRGEMLAETRLGSGSNQCYSRNIFNSWQVNRAWCCEAETATSAWQDCMWYDDRDSFARGGEGNCRTTCPDGYSKIGIDDSNDYCRPGTQRARCCRPFVRTSARSPAESLEHLEAVMRQWTDNPECPADSFARRSLAATTSGAEWATRVVEARQADRSAPAVMENALVYMLSNDPNGDAAKPTFNSWDRIVAERWSSLTSDAVIGLFAGSTTVRSEVSKNQAGYANAMLCQMDEWNDFVRRGGQKQQAQCDMSLLYSRDPDLFDDPDDGGIDTGRIGDMVLENPWIIRPGGIRPGGIPVIQARAGKTRQYPIMINGLGRIVITSLTYINGANGQNLARANGDDNRYYMVRTNDNCGVGIVEDDGDENVVVHSEHIMEQQTVGRFLEFIFNGQLDAVPGATRGVLASPMLNPSDALSSTLFSYFETPFPAFEREFGSGQTPISQMFNVIGSVQDSDLMVNAQDVINGMKARVWGFRNPVAAQRWFQDFAVADGEAFSAAGAEIQAVFATFNYLNHPTIYQNMRSISERMGDILERVEDLIQQQHRANTGIDLPPLSLGLVWRDFMTIYIQRIVTHAKEWLEDMLQGARGLRSTWQDHLESLLDGTSTSSPVDITIALVVIEQIDAWLDSISNDAIRFPDDPF